MGNAVFELFIHCLTPYLIAISHAKTVQASAMKVYFLIAERSLLYAKTVQASAMKVYFLIAERSLFYAKTVQASAMKVYFLIAERSLFYAKIVNRTCYMPQYHKLFKQI